MPRRSKQSLQDKCLQLQISFDEIMAANPVSFPKSSNPSKIYIPMEMARFPFFMRNKSELVSTSRRGFEAFRKARSLKQKGVDLDSIREQTTYTTSPVNRIAELQDTSEPFPCGPGTAADPTELVHRVDKWSIHAHEDYGFPNEVDGWYWDYILNQISSIYQKSGKFYYIYFLNPNEMIRHRIGQGKPSSTRIRGRFYEELMDSLSRLRSTSFSHEKGIFRKDNQSFLLNENYEFSLISGVYRKGERLPDGSIAAYLAVTIEPLIILNFTNNHYLILLNDIRASIPSLLSKSLFDRISYLTFNSLASGDLLIAHKFSLPPFIVLSYANLCAFLGIKPKQKEELKPSKLKIQLEQFYNPLLSASVIIDVVYDRTPSSFNVIFVLSDAFVLKIASISSRKPSLDAPLTDNQIKSYFKKINAMLFSPEARQVLSLKVGSADCSA